MFHSLSRRRGRALPLPALQRAAAGADSSTGHIFDDVDPDPNGSGSTRYPIRAFILVENACHPEARKVDD